MSHAYLFLLFAKSHNDFSSECAPQVLFPSVGVLFLHTYTVACYTCMFVIGLKLFEAVFQTVRTHSVKTDVTLPLYANIPTAAGLQDCLSLVGRSRSVYTSLLASDKKRPARLFADVPVCSLCKLFVTINLLSQ